jgi:DnaJ-class molecular chaperone
MNKVSCTRCGGSGVIPQYRHNGGECFKCGGHGFVVYIKKEKATTRNNIEYLAFIDDQSNVVYVHKFEKKLSVNKAMQLMDTIAPDLSYKYTSLCSEDDISKLI